MDDKATKRGGGAVLVVVLVGALVVPPLLYVLSAGPVILMADNGWVELGDDSIAGRIYYPLQWAAAKSPRFREALARYTSLWQPPTKPFTKPIPKRIGGPSKPLVVDP